jgi:hypothetical protein
VLIDRAPHVVTENFYSDSLQNSISILESIVRMWRQHIHGPARSSVYNRDNLGFSRTVLMWWQHIHG